MKYSRAKIEQEISRSDSEQNLRIRTGVAAVPIKPFGTGGGLKDRIFAVFARISDPSGRVGFGYSMFLDEQLAERAAAAAARLVALRGSSLSALLDIETLEENVPQGEPLISHSAANAISLASWDLYGNQRGLSCAELWGGIARPLSCYDSRHLAFAGLGEIESALANARADHLSAAKIAVGASDLETDLARIRKAQSYLGDGKLAVDAVRRWSVEQANYVIEQLSHPLLWLEDPVPYSDLQRLAGDVKLAVGEISCTREDLEDLLHVGADYLLPDLGCIGGPLRFLDVAVEFAARGIGVGSHGYPYYSLHLLNCIESPLALEIMDWGRALFINPPCLDGDGKMMARGPGFGLTVNHEFLVASASHCVETAP